MFGQSSVYVSESRKLGDVDASMTFPGWKCLKCKGNSVVVAAAKQFGPFFCYNCTHVSESDVLPLEVEKCVS